MSYCGSMGAKYGEIPLSSGSVGDGHGLYLDARMKFGEFLELNQEDLLRDEVGKWRNGVTSEVLD